MANIPIIQTNSEKSKLFYIIILLNMLLFGLAFVLEQYLLIASSVALSVVFLVLLNPQLVYFILVFILPFSSEFRIEAINLNISMAEPFIGILAMVVVIDILFTSKYHNVIKHPLTWAVFFIITAQFISLVNSTAFTVSIKSFILNFCYILVFYFNTWYIVTQNFHKIKSIWTVILIGMIGVSSWITYKHSAYGFYKGSSMLVCPPFFSDHTIYGACLAFCIPFVWFFYINRNKLSFSFNQKVFYFIGSIVLSFGVFFSHSRATWLSVVAMLVFYFILKFKISYKSLMIIFSFLIIIITINQEALMPLLLKNKNDSKAKRANLSEQIKSVTNVKNDVSNAERVNRWFCAVRMFKEKPFTGFGIGTYQFKYIPFQKESEMTVISVTSAKNNINQGEGGTAHSEYLLTLSETGILGLLGLLFIVFAVVYFGMKNYYNMGNEHQLYAMVLLLGLITYFVHGVFNNFLTTDKAAFMFWGTIAMLAALDQKRLTEIYEKEKVR